MASARPDAIRRFGWTERAAHWWLASVIFGSVWALFHILIVILQAYIFMMLTVVYISLAHEHH